ncbi:MAG TPA: hypothetical protein VFZ05_02065 [Nitrososphaera sp.]
MADAWLEVRSCSESSMELDRETVLLHPALSEAMKVAENAAADTQRKGGKYWEYSVRLAENEIREMSGLFAEGTAKDDGRSTSRTLDVMYNGRCYALTLFAFKE